MTSGNPATRGKRRRGELTRELIVRESLRLLDANGVTGFSLPKLGHALGADPTAVYRHFASKDDLVLAIADHLLAQAHSEMPASDCWVADLEESCRRLRAVYLEHPAAASLSACRTTQGPAEMHGVNGIINAVLRAGFDGAEAAVVFRAIGDFGLLWSGSEATFLALDDRLQKNDCDAWTSAYMNADPAEYPAIYQIRHHLPDVKDDDIFDVILSFVLSGLQARAPRPCGCPRHTTPPGPQKVGHL